MFVNKVNCMVKHNEIPRTCFSYEKPLQCLLISANAYFCTFADENEKKILKFASFSNIHISSKQ